MNNRTRNIVLLSGAAIVGIWLALSLSRSMYFTPRAEKLATIEQLSQRELQRASITPLVVKRQLQDYADRTLGSSRETVDHMLRTQLNRMTEDIGLSDVAVGTANATVKLSPARTVFARDGLQGELRDQPDFIEVEAWVNAKGTLEQVVALVDRIEAASWLKRMDKVRVQAEEGGARCAVTIRLTTLLLPDVSPSKTPTLEPYSRERLARYASVLGTNPFALPAPPIAPVVEPVRVVENSEPSPPPKFPYDKWSLTGVAFGPDGGEAWLKSASTGETLRLIVGQTIGDARLLAAQGENARFELNQTQFLVSIGDTLSEQTVVTP